MENTASVWEDPQCPFRVEWEPHKLNQMRIAVVDAFYALPRGGIEIGGVLLGRLEGKVIRIENFSMIECEHLTGPSFVLSPKDEAALEAQLAGLNGQVVGWFHSHTRSEIHFSPGDVEIHNRFFPKASHIAMVLRPANSQPPKANYFFRGPKAEIIGGKNTFVVESIKGKPAPVVLQVTEVPDETVEIPVAPQVESPIDPQVKPLALPVFLRELEPVQTPRKFLWIGAGLLVVALAVAAFFTRGLWMPQ